MRPIRLVLLLLALAAVFAPQALAARPTTTKNGCAFNSQLASEHFMLHWTGDNEVCSAERIDEPTAGDVLAAAENAYSQYLTSWGFLAPQLDADGLIDIYVYDTAPYVGIFGADDAPDAQDGWFSLNTKDVLKREVVGSGVFHTLALAYDGDFQTWFLFGSAEWAGLRAAGWPEADSSLTAPDITLNCYGDPCYETVYHYNGQARWPFYVYLQDRFGENAVRGVWEELDANDPVGNGGIAALQDYLSARGTSLTDFFNDFAGAVAKGDLSAPSLKGKSPTLYATIQTGAAATTLPAKTVAVNHLAARFVGIAPGTSKAGVCHPATLTVTVDVPAGTSAKPKWYFTGPGGGLTDFSISGSKGTYGTAWDTCTWGDERVGIVSLPNASTSVNGAEFKVTATLSAINTSVILSPDAPPTVDDPRPSVATPDAAPPLLSLHAPAVIRVAKSRRLRLHLYASNEGLVRLRLDGRDLGSIAVRAGQNVFRVKLPLLKASSRRIAERSRLSITALSESGQTGATISRRLVIARPASTRSRR